jgi:hypothetical protein
MGRIHDAELKALTDRWSSLVVRLLTEIAERQWPPRRVRRSLFKKPELVQRYLLEGPVPYRGGVAWAISHTSLPSAFDETGELSEGQREFYLVLLQDGAPPSFSIEGKTKQEQIAADEAAFTHAVHEAHRHGPKHDRFYGNKGPLSHR